MFDRTTCAQPAGFVCDSQRRLHRAGLSPISAATDGQSTWPSRPVPDSTASRSASTSRRPQPSRGANGSSVAPGGGCPASLSWSARPPRRAAAGCCPAGGGRWPPRLGGGWCRVAGRGRDGCGGPPRPCLGSAPPPLACAGSACPPPPPPATPPGGVGWGGAGALAPLARLVPCARHRYGQLQRSRAIRHPLGPPAGGHAGRLPQLAGRCRVGRRKCPTRSHNPNFSSWEHA